MRIWLFAQAISQFDSVYGEAERNRILGTVNIIQSFGITDLKSQQVMRDRIGKTTVTTSEVTHTNTRSTQKTPNSNDPRRNETTNTISDTHTNKENKFGRDLIQDSELERDPHIITVSPAGPMRLYLWQYWQSPFDEISAYYAQKFKDGRADKNPNIN